MNITRCAASILGGFFAISMIFSSPAAAQGDDLDTMLNKSLLAMKVEKWEEALAIFNRIIDRFGKINPQQLFGAQFGVIYYRRGICESKLKRWPEAMKSFEICYRDFPNAGAKPGTGNIFHKRALLRWGEAAIGAEDWALALRQFKKFIEEREKTDEYSQGAFYINVCIAYYKLGKIREGNENLEIAIKNKETFPTPDAGILAGFQALVGAVIEKSNEQALLDFIAKNRGDITVEPFEMHDFSRLFMKLAADAVSADMSRAAMALYQMIPATEAAIDDTQVRIDALSLRRQVKDGARVISTKQLVENLKSFEAERRASKPTETTKLAAAAFIHEKYGNVRGAWAAYEQLELYFPKSDKREDNLYNLVRTSSVIGEVISSERYGREFLKIFPNSAHVPAVRRMMLSSLFYEGEYETCIEVASSMIDTLEKGSKEHDICLHVLGGSYYYTGKFDLAQPLLDQHAEKYPESQFIEASLYFQASNLSRLQFWSKSATLLDAFFVKYPDPKGNIFFPFALYDRANCHYAEDEYDAALEKLTRLKTEFPNAEVMDMALNLEGNVQQSLKNREAAEKDYLEALALAEKRGNPNVSAEALYYLVALLGEKKKGDKELNPRLKDAVPFADKFWKEHGKDSTYKTQVAVAQVAALDSVGRGEEALNRLRDVISEMSTSGQTGSLEAAVNSYTEAYLGDGADGKPKHTPEELKVHYYDFPGIRASDKAARALLRIAIIGVFEEVGRKAQDDETKQSKANAMIKVLFQELKTDFKPKELTNFILVNLGDYLRKNTTAVREALPYYDEAISRPDQSYRFAALFGRGDVYARSTVPADLDKGIVDFERVLADSTEKAERESALYRMIEAQLAKGDFVKATDNAKLYLDREKTGFSKYSPQVGFLLARSYQERGEVNDAIAAYVKVWGANQGFIKISAPAFRNWMELCWQRNLPGDPARNAEADRQGAYNGGAKFIEATNRPEFQAKMSDEDKVLWKEVEQLVKKFESDPSIKSLAQQKKDRDAGRGPKK
ncbi:MAG: tetratricopeptide repeat protein [Verrucomicrobia bacterium]|nr:tetratricopeptide repeat protein [Verrucomicrobiota bacterium]